MLGKTPKELNITEEEELFFIYAMNHEVEQMNARR
jgi:hypothetical protein